MKRTGVRRDKHVINISLSEETSVRFIKAKYYKHNIVILEKKNYKNYDFYRRKIYISLNQK